MAYLRRKPQKDHPWQEPVQTNELLGFCVSLASEEILAGIPTVAEGGLGTWCL